MYAFKFNISLIFVLVSLFSVRANSQLINNHDSLVVNNSQKVILKPQVHYSLGSTFMVVPHLGTVTGFTLSPFLSVPLSPRLSVDGGVFAGRFYSSLSDINSEGPINGAFNELSVYGSAIYRINAQLTVYGAGIRQLSGTSPFYSLPKSSYLIGSTYKFGNSSIGITLQMSNWNYNLSPFPFNGAQRFYSPYGK